MWNPPVKEWYKIPTDTYKFIYEEAKYRLEEHLSESESITNKSIKIFTSVAALYGFMLGYFIKYQSNLYLFGIISLLFLIETIFLFYLIAPKKVRWRGMEPNIIFQSGLDNEEDNGYQTQLTYYTSITVAQDNISFMIDRNNHRIRIYKAAFLLLIILLTTTVAFVIIHL